MLKCKNCNSMVISVRADTFFSVDNDGAVCAEFTAGELDDFHSYEFICMHCGHYGDELEKVADVL